MGGATPGFMFVEAGGTISIHAPRGGSDKTNCKRLTKLSNFNPRSPWGERPFGFIPIPGKGGFQSTLPVGGATLRNWIIARYGNISIHAPRGGSDPGFAALISQSGHFNPRSPWGERLEALNRNTDVMQFQSTLPVGGATRASSCKFHKNRISIHAPRGGSDLRNWIIARYHNISIHAPRGGSDKRPTMSIL